MTNFGEKVSFVWSVADLLRGPTAQQYKDVMLPMTVLRRLGRVLEPTKDAVLVEAAGLAGGKLKNVERCSIGSRAAPSTTRAGSPWSDGS